MIKCIIVDDEPGNVSIMRKLLKQYCPGVEVCADAGNIAEAKKKIAEHAPQLVLLDIEMPKGNAFDLLNDLMPVSFEIIFVTAFDNYAVTAFRYSALDYILKPVDIETLQAAVVKAGKKIQDKTINQRLENLLAMVQPGKAISKIALPANNGLVFYELSDIIYCNAEGAYTRFYFKNDKSVLVSGTLKDYADLLPESMFCRIHNSFIINLGFVRKYYKGKGGVVEMLDGKKFEISFRKKGDFLARFKSER